MIEAIKENIETTPGNDGFDFFLTHSLNQSYSA